ncbi:hypothetical protein [Ammoniphilus sp. CFH 90114]|uniref:hypothetical protein n=1 Tax=Ammoniphilus sp. CFH 90114 TaxID=2493665 RepID=UPI00100F89EA|nr:hypothetical protein [Ammoniphilus sp. CFH 90114]RXT02346.1 hypothetical protein EIZ39_24840 [Ammoniphilus sp. CFH 90114]
MNQELREIMRKREEMEKEARNVGGIKAKDVGHFVPTQQQIMKFDRLLELWKLLQRLQEKFPYLYIIPRLEWDDWNCDGLLITDNAVYVFHIFPEKIDHLSFAYPEIHVSTTHPFNHQEDGIHIHSENQVVTSWSLGKSRGILGGLRNRLGLTDLPIYELYITSERSVPLLTPMEQTAILTPANLEKVLNRLTFPQDEKNQADQQLFYRYLAIKGSFSSEGSQAPTRLLTYIRKFDHYLDRELELVAKIDKCEERLHEIDGHRSQLIEYIHANQMDQLNVQHRLNELKKIYTRIIALVCIKINKHNQEKKRLRDKLSLYQSTLLEDQQMISQLNEDAMKLNVEKESLAQELRSIRLEKDLQSRRIHELALVGCL